MRVWGGASLEVRWLRLLASMAGACLLSLIRELKSHMPRSAVAGVGGGGGGGQKETSWAFMVPAGAEGLMGSDLSSFSQLSLEDWTVF